MKVQETVRRGAGRVALHVVFMTLVMLAVFFTPHLTSPKKISFSYGTAFSALLDAAAGILNFFLMGLTIQHVASLEDSKEAKRLTQRSYMSRNILQIVWMILAVAVSIVHPIADILPLFFPGFSVWLQGILPPKEEQKTKQGGKI